jgi:N-acetylglucosamine kinase-like BadF-type ATPase
VAAACADGDPVAARITSAAVCPRAEGARVAVTGGLLKLGDALVAPLEEELAKRLPHARRVVAEGDPLDGSVRVATGLATGSLTLPGDKAMLWVTTAPES